MDRNSRGRGIGDQNQNFCKRNRGCAKSSSKWCVIIKARSNANTNADQALLSGAAGSTWPRKAIRARASA